VNEADPYVSSRAGRAPYRPEADRLRPPTGPPRPRLLRGLVVLLSAVVLVVSVGGWVSYAYFNGQIGRISLSLGGDRPAAAAGGTTNYLLVGTDSRAGSGGQFGNVPGERSDTTILVHLAKDGSTTMVSFPRDTLVTIPAYTDSSGKQHPEQRNKFNAAIDLGGPSLLVRTVEKLTDIRVDHYVSLDLEGFKAMTDAIGGVTVCVKPSTFREYVPESGRVSTNTDDPMSGFVGGPGTIHLNGALGLAFVRQRHGLANGDLGRIQRQQQYLGAVFRKATTGGVLANPIKLEGLVSTATSALTLDSRTSMNDLRKLASRLRGVAAGNVKMETLPTHVATAADGATDGAGNIPGIGDVQVADPAATEAFLAPLRSSKGSSASAAPSTAPAADVHVQVFNGSRVAGLASTTTTKLTALGFHATLGGTAQSQAYVTSRVLYPAGQEAAARAVQAVVAGSKLQAQAGVPGVQLIIGSSFTGVSGSGPASSTGTASSTRPATTASPAAPATTAAAPSCTF
jgi:LCP family protein required for cell wall assembly